MILKTLETVTTLVLLGVALALGWMIAAAYAPAATAWAPVEVEAAVILALLTAALLLVSVVALLHTRKHDLP
jgi:hypothetical protein